MAAERHSSSAIVGVTDPNSGPLLVCTSRCTSLKTDESETKLVLFFGKNDGVPARDSAQVVKTVGEFDATPDRTARRWWPKAWKLQPRPALVAELTLQQNDLAEVVVKDTEARRRAHGAR